MSIPIWMIDMTYVSTKYHLVEDGLYINRMLPNKLRFAGCCISIFSWEKYLASGGVAIITVPAACNANQQAGRIGFYDAFGCGSWHRRNVPFVGCSMVFLFSVGNPHHWFEGQRLSALRNQTISVLNVEPPPSGCAFGSLIRPARSLLGRYLLALLGEPAFGLVLGMPSAILSSQRLREELRDDSTTKVKSDDCFNQIGCGRDFLTMKRW